MATLIYMAHTSLDGYVEDETGGIDWSVPDENVIRLINELERPIGTYLLGRRLHESMIVWEDPLFVSDQPPVLQEFASIWQAADKVVYSRTLQAVTSARMRLERTFDVEQVRHLKRSLPGAISVGGATLAAQAISAGLVDDYHLFLTPVSVGGGIPALPRHARLPLTLVDEHRFASGVVHLHYRNRT